MNLETEGGRWTYIAPMDEPGHEREPDEEAFEMWTHIHEVLDRLKRDAVGAAPGSVTPPDPSIFELPELCGRILAEIRLCLNLGLEWSEAASPSARRLVREVADLVHRGAALQGVTCPFCNG
jgi:hypothetical protein